MTSESEHSDPPLVGDPPDIVPARMVNEVLYCERLAYLEWAQKEFADNFYTVEGRTVTHRKVDEGGGKVADPDDARPWSARSVWLTSESLGLTAKIDLVEGDDGKVAPVEYKRGRRPDVVEGAYDPERAQLCAQVLLLRDHGYECTESWIWYAKSRERVLITIDSELEAMTLAAITRLREVVAEAKMPPPLDSSPKCNGCSLSGLCLPDEVALLKTQEQRRVRRLHPANDDRTALYVQEQGARIGVSKERLVVKGRDGEKHEVRLPNTSQVCVFGNVQISTQAIRAMLGRGIPIAFFSGGGWFLGRTLCHESKNVELRVAQYRTYLDEPWRLKLARTVVRNKILNQRTMLRRNAADVDEAVLIELKHLSRKVDVQDSRASLLGIEGTAARVYFNAFSGMLKGDEALNDFDLTKRTRRPPRDPINALLSFAYGLLSKEWTLTLATVGLDPMLGFFHEPRFGRPALALDLMEPFRPLLADSIVLGVINNGSIVANDFIRTRTSCAMKTHARRKLIAAFERRMSQEITHPVFSYRISYRRTLEVQARLLGRHLLGEIDTYPEFRTR